MSAANIEPERVIATEPIFQGRVFRVRVDTVSLPSGRETSREVVEHNGSVVIVPIDSDDNVILVRQYRHPTGRVLLEAPAGTLEGSEDPDDCAQRELREETGFASRDLRSLGGFWTVPGFCTEYIRAYVARDLVPSKLAQDYDEDIEIDRRPLSQIPDLIRRGEIQDAKTLAALLLTNCFSGTMVSLPVSGPHRSVQEICIVKTAIHPGSEMPRSI